MTYIDKANLPVEKVQYVLASGKLKNIDVIEKKYGIKIIKTKPCNSVYNEIKYHPDIQMIHLGNNKIIIEPTMLKDYIEEFESIGMYLIDGNTKIGAEYPKDVAYNACIVGKYFLHNLDYTDKNLLNYVDNMGLEMINIKQGYSKCNISIVNENNIITGDKGIEKALKKYLNVLCIDTAGQIKLGNMDGFIGGSTGLISQDTWLINGDINRLKDVNKIKDFMDINNVKIECINEGEVEDIGSILPIM